MKVSPIICPRPITIRPKPITCPRPPHAVPGARFAAALDAAAGARRIAA